MTRPSVRGLVLAGFLALGAAAQAGPGPAAPARAGPARAGPARTVETPFPTDRTRIIRDTEVVYVVEGRIVIPPRVEITGQKGIRIRGKGKDAVIEVQGSLVIHGVTGRDVEISGVRIEPARAVQQLHLDHCKLVGGSGVTTPGEKTTSGMITIENCEFDSTSPLDLDLTAGKVKVMSVSCALVLRLRGIDLKGKRNKIYGSVRTCKLQGGVLIENVADVTLRGNVLKGTSVTLRNNRILVFDGNLVEAGSIVIEQSKAGRFKKTVFTKCDLYCATIRIFAPADGKKRERVVLDKCYFGGTTDDEKIAEIVQDSRDDPKNGVRVLWKKPLKRPLGLAGSAGS